jgi:hypothetical protein
VMGEAYGGYRECGGCETNAVGGHVEKNSLQPESTTSILQHMFI